MAFNSFKFVAVNTNNNLLKFQMHSTYRSVKYDILKFHDLVGCPKGTTFTPLNENAWENSNFEMLYLLTYLRRCCEIWSDNLRHQHLKFMQSLGCWGKWLIFIPNMVFSVSWAHWEKHKISCVLFNCYKYCSYHEQAAIIILIWVVWGSHKQAGHCLCSVHKADAFGAYVANIRFCSSAHL